MGTYSVAMAVRCNVPSLAKSVHTHTAPLPKALAGIDTPEYTSKNEELFKPESVRTRKNCRNPGAPANHDPELILNPISSLLLLSRLLPFFSSSPPSFPHLISPLEWG